jgi:site-specific DNA-methyltransferase (adenine-specific)
MLEEFISEVAIELLRVIIPGGFLLFFMQPRLYDPMATAVRNAGFEVRDGLAWQHGGGQGKAFTLNHCVRKMKIPQEEKDALIASMKGGTTPQLRPVQEWMVLAQKPKEGTFVENWQKWRTGLVWPNFPNGQQTTVFSYMKPNSRKTIDHLTIKPVELMEQLLRVFSIEGHTVVDPFTGSGTTGIACARTGRRFVGFEIDRGYLDHLARACAPGPVRSNRGPNVSSLPCLASLWVD